MADTGRTAAEEGGALTREFRELTERCRELERRLEAVSFECNGYYGEWQHARNQLDEIHRSRMWSFWMASIAARRTARLPLRRVAAQASGIAGSLRRWVGRGGGAPPEAAGGPGHEGGGGPAAQIGPQRNEEGIRVATEGSGVLELLTRANPKLHYDEHNLPVSWGIDADVLREIDATIERGSRTLETGAGLSTVLFAAKACRHTVVCPDKRHLRSIVSFCGENGISLDTVEMVAERSELYLPRVVGLDLDAALIDGRHAFPSPFIDWFYIASNLRVGGVLIVDDTPIFTGRVLDEFLSEDPHWELLRRFPRTSFFAKRSADVHGQEWNKQPYIRRLSS